MLSSLRILHICQGETGYATHLVVIVAGDLIGFGDTGLVQVADREDRKTTGQVVMVKGGNDEGTQILR